MRDYLWDKEAILGAETNQVGDGKHSRISKEQRVEIRKMVVVGGNHEAAMTGRIQKQVQR